MFGGRFFWLRDFGFGAKITPGLWANFPWKKSERPKATTQWICEAFAWAAGVYVMDIYIYYVYIYIYVYLCIYIYPQLGSSLPQVIHHIFVESPYKDPPLDLGSHDCFPFTVPLGSTSASHTECGKWVIESEGGPCDGQHPSTPRCCSPEMDSLRSSGRPFFSHPHGPKTPPRFFTSLKTSDCWTSKPQNLVDTQDKCSFPCGEEK